MNESTRQIVTAVAAASAAAIATALITHYLTKSATIQSVASGATPLPPGSKPTTTNVQPQGSTPNPQPAPQPPPAPPPPKPGVLANVAQTTEQQLGWIASSWKAMGFQSP